MCIRDRLYIKHTIIRIPAPIPFLHTPSPNLPTKKPLQVPDILSHTAEEGAHHPETRTGKNKVSSQVKVNNQY